VEYVQKILNAEAAECTVLIPDSSEFLDSLDFSRFSEAVANGASVMSPPAAGFALVCTVRVMMIRA
jgi:hypothetical protein